MEVLEAVLLVWRRHHVQTPPKMTGDWSDLEMLLEKRKLQELDPIFYPRSIAVVGVSSDEDRVPALWFKTLTSSGFKGAVYAVNKKEGRFRGHRIWPSLASIPGPVDLAIVCIPRSSVIDLLRECAEKKVKCVQFYTAGFSESGEPEWAEAEKTMVGIARKGGFRIIGPNCFGVYNPGYDISVRAVQRHAFPGIGGTHRPERRHHGQGPGVWHGPGPGVWQRYQHRQRV